MRPAAAADLLSPPPGARGRAILPALGLWLGCGMGLTGALAGVSGCTGAEFAVVGAATGAANTARGIWTRGELRAAVPRELPPIRDAAREALVGLGFEVVHDTEGQGAQAGTAVLKGADARGERVVVRLDQRTETLTRVTVDVGYFGHEATARLLAARIFAALGAEDAPLLLP